MRRRFWTCLLAAVLICQMALPLARADAPKVYFTAAGESVLPLSDDTMPFWRGGYLYIPSNMFTGNVWRSLGISYIRNNKGTVILHNASQAAGRSLLFEPGKSYCKDSDDNTHKPGAVERNGVVFVPAFLVADFFGLQYSVTEVPRGYLVWLRKPGFGLTDQYFADAANYNMESAYDAYLRAKDRDSQQPEPQPEPEPEEEPGNPGAGIYLSLEAGPETAGMLDLLAREHSFAAFFCGPEFLDTQDTLLRRMTATGQTIGLLADGRNPELSVLDQLEQGNQKLEDATCGRTRLAYVKNASEEQITQAEGAGYICLDPDLDRSGYSLKSASNASSLMKRISQMRGSVSVWLGSSASEAGLRQLLVAVDRAGDRCFALTETAA